MGWFLLVLLLCLGMASGARAEPPIVLMPGPGRDTVELHCTACHSLDYIEMNSRFLTRAQWRSEVTKMIEAFGAPIDPSDAAAITDYLTSTYGG
jgi:hypothetical protein